MKKIKTATVILSILAASLLNQYQAQANPVLQQLWENVGKGAVQGAAQEAGSRLMEGLINSLSTSSTEETIVWRSGLPHPRYPNVVSSVETNRWQPLQGYAWADPTNPNDWTVILDGENRSNYGVAPYVSGQQNNTKYQVTYSGDDGVNLRAEPGGSSILATAYKQNAISIRGLSSEPVIRNGLPWVKVELYGWMAKKQFGKDYSYLRPIGDDISVVTWDGGDNPTDNFIALKAESDISATRIAKIYTFTSVRTGEYKINGNFEWTRVKLIGWMALRSAKGTQLISEIAP